MKTRLDLTDCTFGSLTAIRPAENMNGRTVWICRCECGTECAVKTVALRSGKRTTCGCRNLGLESLNYVDGTCIEMIQSKTVRSNNKSGATGVYFDKNTGKWRAVIMFKGKRKCLGRFTDFSEAVEARALAEKQIHDEYVFAYHNSTKAESREQGAESFAPGND